MNSKLLKLTEEEFQGIEEEMQSILQGGGGIIDVYHGGHTVGSCIPGEHGESIHVKGWCLPLDGSCGT